MIDTPSETDIWSVDATGCPLGPPGGVAGEAHAAQAAAIAIDGTVHVRRIRNMIDILLNGLRTVRLLTSREYHV
jgi:hypothetical protein